MNLEEKELLLATANLCLHGGISAKNRLRDALKAVKPDDLPKATHIAHTTISFAQDPPRSGYASIRACLDRNPDGEYRCTIAEFAPYSPPREVSRYSNDWRGSIHLAREAFTHSTMRNDVVYNATYDLAHKAAAFLDPQCLACASGPCSKHKPPKPTLEESMRGFQKDFIEAKKEILESLAPLKADTAPEGLNQRSLCDALNAPKPCDCPSIRHYRGIHSLVAGGGMYYCADCGQLWEYEGFPLGIIGTLEGKDAQRYKIAPGQRIMS